MLQMEDNEHFVDDDEEPVSVGKITAQHNDVTEIIPLQAPLKPEQSSPVTLNVNINFCTPTQTVVPAVSHTTIVDPLTHGEVKNIDIS